MNFLEHLFLHVSHSLVDRVLANGAGCPVSIPGGVTGVMREEGQQKLRVMRGETKCDVGIDFI